MVQDRRDQGQLVLLDEVRLVSRVRRWRSDRSVGEEELHHGLHGTEARQDQPVANGHEGVGQAGRGRSLPSIAVEHHLTSQ